MVDKIGKFGVSHNVARKIAKNSLKKECNNCGIKTGLVVHHKDGSSRNNDPSNLMFLCHSCHANHHEINKGIKHPLFGKTRSEKTRRNISLAIKNWWKERKGGIKNY